MEKKDSIQVTLHNDKKWKVIYEQDQEYLKNFKSKNYCSYQGKSYVLLPKHVAMSDYFTKNLENADNQTLQLKMEDELNPEAFDAAMRLIYGATDVTLENNWLLDVYTILKSLSNLIYLAILMLIIGIPSSEDIIIDPLFMKEFVEDILKVLSPEDYLRFYDRANHYEDISTQDKVAEIIRSTKLTETLTEDSIERISLPSIETWLKYNAQQKQLAISEKRSTSDFLSGDKIYELIIFALRSLDTQNPEIKKDWISKFVIVGPEEPSSLNNLLLAQVDVKENERKTIELLKTNAVAINNKIDLERERTNMHLKNIHNSIIDHQTKQFEEQNAKIEQLEKLVMRLLAHSEKEETAQSKFVFDRFSSITENKTSELVAKLDDKTTTILQKIENKAEEQSSKFEERLSKLQEKLDEKFTNLTETERIGKVKIEEQSSKFEQRFSKLQEKLDENFTNLTRSIEKVDVDLTTIQSATLRQENLCSQSLENIKLIQENGNLLKKQYESSLEAVRSSLHTDIEFTWKSSILISFLGTDKNTLTSALHSIRKFENLSKYSQPNLLKNILPFTSFAYKYDANKIFQDIKLETLKLFGFKIAFEADWKYQHKYEELEKLCNKYSETALVCMAGQKNKDSDLIDLCAISPIREAFKKTSSTEEAYPIGDVYWYCVPDKSFGFAEEKNIKLNDADVKSSPKRMSWSFSHGGYRMGIEGGHTGSFKKYLLILEN